MPSSPDTLPPDETPTPTPGRKRTRRRVAWTHGARLLGSGETPAAVAAALGIAEERLWRHLESSRRFRRLLDEAIDMRNFTAAWQQIARDSGD